MRCTSASQHTNWKHSATTLSCLAPRIERAQRASTALPTGCVNSTPTIIARTELHSMITVHHAKARGSRAGRLRIAHLCVPKAIFHLRVMAHSLPHLTLTTNTNSLSPISSTSPIFPTVSPAHTRFVALDPYLPCDVPRQSGGSTQIPSHRL